MVSELLPTAMESVDGHQVRVARIGSGPPVILLHGYPDNLQIWARLARKIADSGFSVIAFDWPGTAFSDEWSGGATPFHMTDRLLKLMDVWQIPRASIVGIDMGGQPALVFAARHPDRIAHLTVMNSLVFGDEETSIEISILRKYGWNRIILKWLPLVVFARALFTFLPHGAKLDEQIKEDLWNGFRQMKVRSYISKMCAGYQGTLHKLPQEYEKITCPMLIMWAGNDKHFPRAQGEKLKRTIPHATLRIVDGAEHWMPYYLADDVAEIMLAELVLRADGGEAG